MEVLAAPRKAVEPVMRMTVCAEAAVVKAAAMRPKSASRFNFIVLVGLGDGCGMVWGEN